jgi:hypothetical protein
MQTVLPRNRATIEQPGGVDAADHRPTLGQSLSPPYTRSRRFRGRRRLQLTPRGPAVRERPVGRCPRSSSSLRCSPSHACSRSIPGMPSGSFERRPARTRQPQAQHRPDCPVGRLQVLATPAGAAPPRGAAAEGSPRYSPRPRRSRSNRGFEPLRLHAAGGDARTLLESGVSDAAHIVGSDRSPPCFLTVEVLGSRRRMRRLRLVDHRRPHAVASGRHAACLSAPLRPTESDRQVSELLRQTRPAAEHLPGWLPTAMKRGPEAHLRAMCAALRERLLHRAGPVT